MFSCKKHIIFLSLHLSIFSLKLSASGESAPEAFREKIRGEVKTNGFYATHEELHLFELNEVIGFEFSVFQSIPEIKRVRGKAFHRDHHQYNKKARHDTVDLGERNLIESSNLFVQNIFEDPEMNVQFVELNFIKFNRSSLDENKISPERSYRKTDLVIHQDRFDVFSPFYIFHENPSLLFDVLVFKVLVSEHVESHMELGYVDPDDMHIAGSTYQAKVKDFAIPRHSASSTFTKSHGFFTESAAGRGYIIDQDFLTGSDLVVLHRNLGYFVANVDEPFERTVMVLRIRTTRPTPEWLRRIKLTSGFDLYFK